MLEQQTVDVLAQWGYGGAVLAVVLLLSLGCVLVLHDLWKG